MQLRSRQREFVDNCVRAIDSEGNTLGVAPTGAGKTVMLSAVHSEYRDKGDTGTHLVLQHRDELVKQNADTMRHYKPSERTFPIDASNKYWSEGNTHFAMVQTLVRNLDDMPKISMLTVDEAHHIAANSYLKIIEHARDANPDLKIFGVTATPQRGDRKAISSVFNNVADAINVKELIDAGHLVRPRALVPEISEDVRTQLAGVKKTAAEYDMQEVAAVMNKGVVNDEVYRHWLEHAGDRSTIVFCSTVDHADAVRDSFASHGVSAAVVSGDTPKGEREDTLAAFDRGDIQVLVNCMVLTEGWDCQRVSCVVLLRPCSFKSTMIQMIGRGLRKVDPERYPGLIKSDCVVLDFGASLLTHGGIDIEDDLEGSQGTKSCPSCETVVPSQLRECPICGFDFPYIETEETAAAEEKEEDEEKGPLDKVVLTELDLFDDSPFKYTEMFGGTVLMCNAIDAWACVISFGDRHHTFGGGKSIGLKYLANADNRLQAVASADDFMRDHGDKTVANKTKRWLHQPASIKQRNLLKLQPTDLLGLTKYEAACWLQWKWSERGMRGKIYAQA